MEKTLILLVLCKAHKMVEAETPQQVSFSALDCSHPKSITYGKLKDFVNRKDRFNPAKRKRLSLSCKKITTA